MKRIIILFFLVGIFLYGEDNGEIFDCLKNNKIYNFDYKNGIKTRVKLDLDGNGTKEGFSFIVNEKIDNEYIKIRAGEDEIKIEKKGSLIKNIFIADFDKNDKFINFGVVFSDKNGENIETFIYQYKKGKISESVKSLNFEIIGINGKGKIYFEDGLIYELDDEEFNEEDVLRYYDFRKGKVVENKIKGVSKRYEKDVEIPVYKNEKDIIDNKEISEAERIEIAKRENILAGTLKKWDKFEILKVKKKTDHVKIKLYNGEKGWIGGNIIK